jgi:hypothetical protein
MTNSDKDKFALLKIQGLCMPQSFDRKATSSEIQKRRDT